MASTKAYLDFVREQMSQLDGVSARPMMGEYVLYCQGKVIGGVYDDRLLLKETPTALRLMAETGLKVERELPYEGAKEMILVDDVDNREFLCELVEDMYEELPAPKKKKG